MNNEKRTLDRKKLIETFTERGLAVIFSKKSHGTYIQHNQLHANAWNELPSELNKVKSKVNSFEAVLDRWTNNNQANRLSKSA